MRFVTRTLGFVLLILASFWFTAENAGQLVWIDFAFFRIRASLPLVVFGSVVLGMGASALVGWRAARRARYRRESASRPASLHAGYEVEDFDFEERRPRESTPLR